MAVGRPAASSAANVTADPQSGKPPLLFIHGFRGSHLGLESLAAEFPDYQVFLPDVPPFGTADPLEAYDPDAYADFIAAYIKEQHLDHPVLIGHSMGSLIAAATAAKHSQDLHEKLVLLAPISVRTPAPITALQPLAARIPNKLASHATTRYLFVPRDRELYRQTLQQVLDCGVHSASDEAILAAAQFSTSYAITDFNFNKDTLLLAGVRDRLISAADTAATAAQLGAKSHFIGNTGHLLNYENPAATATAIRTFLEK